MPSQTWSKTQHESGVEQFYATGIQGFHDYHHGYLNFGLWTRPNMSYLEAAENLIGHCGDLLGLNGDSELLDCGCGMGTQDVFLMRTFQPKSIDAIDVTHKHIERARERAQRESIPDDRLRFQHASATRLPWSDQQFTHVLAVESPEHMDTREKFFTEAFRVLKPGGALVICDYSLVRAPENIFEKAVAEFARRLWHVPKANVYGDEGFRERLNRAGFNKISIERVGAQTIPGYYVEQRRPETIRELRAIRGFWKGVVGGWFVDVGVYGAFRAGLVEYVIIRAEK